MDESSRPTSFSSNRISIDQLSIPATTDDIIFQESAILHTRDDISTDSENSSTDGNEQAYDLQLVVKALKTTIIQRKEQQEQEKEHQKEQNVEQLLIAEEVEEETNTNDDDSTSSSISLNTLSTHPIDEQQLERLNIIIDPSTQQQVITNNNEQDEQKENKNLLNPVSTTTSSSWANWVQLQPIKSNSLPPNLLTVADQEKQDESATLAMEYFFNNQFMKAKQLFEEHASTDPLHSLGLSSMVFLKAIMTDDPKLRKDSLKALLHTYDISTSQIESTTKHQGMFSGNTVVQYFQFCYNYIKCGNHHLAQHPTPRRHRHHHGTENDNPLVLNGILRAHIIKAECCLQMALLHLLQGTYTGYIQCGLNIRRAYSSYYFVWQEHQRMGQFYADHIDQDTLSGLQFGIGAVHLILDALPLKIRKVVSSFGWKPEKQLGMALIHLSKENKRLRSPWASLLLLAYYSILTSMCPEILMIEYTQPAIKILLEAQQLYPHSAFFLHFAGRISRIGRNFTLSTQSFLYAIEISKSDWAELDVFHLCSYEIGMNAMIQMDWHEAIKIFDILYEQDYWSRGVIRYLHGACLSMLKLDTDAILHFAQVPDLLLLTNESTFYKNEHRTITSTTKKLPTHLKEIERYVLHRCQFLESNGYQDIRLSLGAIEFICLNDGIRYLDASLLEHYLSLIDDTLQNMIELEQMEYTIRENEIDPDTPLPCYTNQRAVLLWMKSCIFNTIEQYDDAVVHLNWIADHAHDIDVDRWVIPYAYWEAGITAWNNDDRTKGREFWEKAARYKNYIFENQISMKIQIALNRADELGIPSSKEISTQLGRSDFKSISLST